MARRIALPSADELFGDAPEAKNQRAATSRKQAAKVAAPAPPKRATSSTSAQSASAKRTTAATATHKRASKPAATQTPAPKPAPARARRAATAESRLSAVEERLGDLRVDALIDLRDGLEDLLAADGIDEAALRRLLDAVVV